MPNKRIHPTRNTARVLKVIQDVMKKKRIAVSIICVLTIGAAVAVWAGRDNLFFFGYLEGRFEARQEIRRDNMTIYVYGDMSRAMLLAPDKDTGLPKKGIAGCLLDRRLIGRAKGHNTLIRKHIAEN